MKCYINTDEECADLFVKIFKISTWKWGYSNHYPTKKQEIQFPVFCVLVR